MPAAWQRRAVFLPVGRPRPEPRDRPRPVPQAIARVCWLDGADPARIRLGATVSPVGGRHQRGRGHRRCPCPLPASRCRGQRSNPPAHPPDGGRRLVLDGCEGPLSARGLVIAPDLAMLCFGARPSFGTILIGGVVPAVYATAEGYRFTRSRFLAVAAAPAVVIFVLGLMACLGPWAGRLASEISAWACRQTLPTR